MLAGKLQAFRARWLQKCDLPRLVSGPAEEGGSQPPFCFCARPENTMTGPCLPRSCQQAYLPLVSSLSRCLGSGGSLYLVPRPRAFERLTVPDLCSQRGRLKDLFS